ncbi:hypothetical protein HY488_01765 [Candidatus Woesearchaeota archaeon]|nr:hypothetical protein [Candidatus Woesearchaeota archaeon]
MFFHIFPAKRGQGHWTQMVSAVLVVVIIVVLVILFTTNVGQSQRTITQCTGIGGIEGLTGQCQQKVSEASPCGDKQMLATASCSNGQVCCIG